MISKVFTIAVLYLKTTYASRATFIFSIAMPLLFTFVLGQAMQGFAPGETPASWPLAIVDLDQSGMSRKLISLLEADPQVEAQLADQTRAQAMLDDGDTIAVLVIPAGFETGLAGGGAVDLTFRQNADDIARAQILQESVRAASAELSGSLAAADLALRVAGRAGLFEGADRGAQAAYHEAAFLEAQEDWAGGAPVAVESEAVTRLAAGPTIPLGASQSSPGMLVMYALFFTFGGGATLLVERDEGTLRRLLVMPMGKGTILTGKLTGIFIGALIQMAIMVLVGQFALGVRWGQSPSAMVVMLLAYGFASTALGLLVAALAKTVAQANAAGVITVMALASLGGAWWPIEIVPQWMQQISLALPTGWAMQGFHDIITRGLDLSAVVLESGVLLAFGALFLALGVWRFQYE